RLLPTEPLRRTRGKREPGVGIILGRKIEILNLDELEFTQTNTGVTAKAHGSHINESALQIRAGEATFIKQKVHIKNRRNACLIYKPKLIHGIGVKPSACGAGKTADAIVRLGMLPR